MRVDMFDSVKKKQFSHPEYSGYSNSSVSLDIVRGEVIITTVDHADIRGLDTA